MLIPTKKNIHLSNSMAGVEPKKGKSGEGDEINEWGLHDTGKSVAEMALKFPNFDFLPPRF